MSELSTEEQLEEIDKELSVLHINFGSLSDEETEINTQISELRFKLQQLRDARSGIKYKLQKATKDKESLLRKRELEIEAVQVEKDLNEKRKEAEILLADAPWKDVAFGWQIEGALRLPNKALVGDRRGMGKTLTALIWRRLQGAKRTLVCVRKEVASEFVKEIHTREPGHVVYDLVSKPSQERIIAAELLKGFENFTVVTNIESWRRTPEKTVEELLKIPYDTVILDEAHHIKNSSTGTAQGFFRLADSIPNILELTGTPIKNRPQEMYSLLHAMYPKEFPRESAFLFDYCYQTSQNRWVFDPRGLANLIKKIHHFYLARTPEDVGRLVPPPQVIEYKLDFDNYPDQARAYREMAERSLAILTSGKAVPIVNQLSLMTRQAQMVSWPAGIIFEIKDPYTGDVLEVVRFDVNQSVKMDWAEDLIGELVEEEQRIILFSRFKPALYELRNRLEQNGLSVALITGDEKISRRDVFNDFDLKTASKNPKYQVLLATYQTVGESANLNAATHVILYDRFWNPGNEDQAIGRIDRINSIEQATVHIPHVEYSIDDYFRELIDQKRNLVADFKTAADMQAKLVDNLKRSV